VAAISAVLLRQSKLMTMRWRERRVEDELLMRELLVRLHAEHSGASGRSGPATGICAVAQISCCFAIRSSPSGTTCSRTSSVSPPRGDICGCCC